MREPPALCSHAAADLERQLAEAHRIFQTQETLCDNLRAGLKEAAANHAVLEGEWEATTELLQGLAIKYGAENFRDIPAAIESRLTRLEEEKAQAETELSAYKTLQRTAMKVAEVATKRAVEAEAREAVMVAKIKELEEHLASRD